MTKTKFKHVSLAFLVILGVVFFFSDAFAGTVSKGCKPLPERFAEMKSCILCPLFEVIIKTDQTIATKAYAALAPSFINVITVVLALFIAYHTLLLVSSFTKQDAPKYIGTILLQTFKVLLAVVLLHDATHIYTYLINPLMNAGLEFGRALLFKDSSGSTGAVLIDSFNSAVSAAKAEMPEGVIGKDLLANIMGSVRMFSEAAAELPAVGGSLICISTHEGTSFLINFEMFFQGLAVYIFGWAIALACCFYLLDSAVRFGIFCVLLPFLIASWPFKITFKYTKTGFDIFMNTFFNFVMIGLVISLTTELLTQAIGGGSGGLDELEAAINGDDVEALKNMVSITGMDFLVLIACGMFAFKLVGQINSLASQFGGGGGSSIGGSIGKLAAQGVGKVAGMAKKGGAAIGGAVYEGTGAKAKVDGIKDNAMDKMANIGAKIGLGNKARPGGAGGNRQFQSSGGGSGSGSGSGGGGSGGSGGGGSGGSGGGGSGGSGGDDGSGGGSGDGSGGGDGVPRNENGNVVLPNGQEVNGLGVASRNSDGGVTFTSQGADGSRNIKSYDKDGNAHMSSFDKDGNKTSDYTINKDGSSKGFIKQDDGTIQQWDEKAGERKREDNVF